MDYQTISVYDQSAEQIATLHKTLVPVRIYQLINQFFVKGGVCADVGCGIGRDSTWLFKQGYPVIGINASEGMLQQAKEYDPNIHYVHDSLPLLEKQTESSFVNVLCSAVIMHLADDQIACAVTNLVRITAVGGVIVVSFRGTNSKDRRENGKLYSIIEVDELISMFAHSGTMLLHREVDFQADRKVEWTSVVFRKLPLLAV
ncbi:bifunctional 2-polyprenyl-6-hydroxyphenol methylase/3-demethylubiquinol 3-O-methyltransferase UbiG [Nitrosomonas sp. Nm33]|uniref:class I SAM-dependent methyltransferase n=1 Tax=Nitrosomonas sp. Nm33 TaxID=133724 RepID=UPI0008973B60|nr:class I SAM-dependent methyltransferase [Nitrosomonas sp. Nm33]SDY13347.1 Methyltransferase domain-containing protein [Nitrosomonas sp. Nm33]